MGKLRLIVFDWDGTLADSVGPIIRCKQFLAQTYELPEPPEALIKEVLGTDFNEAMKRCFPNTSDDLLEKIKQEFKQLMQQEGYQANLFSGVREMLAALKGQGITLAIATSKSRSEFTTALAYTELEEYFDYICCAEDYKPKPDPMMLNYLLQHYSLNPENCLMLGDTTADIQFATNAQIPIICVTFGAHSRESLAQHNPLALIDEWEQLFPMIEQEVKDLSHLEEILANSIYSENVEENDPKQGLNKNPSMFNLS